MSVIGFFILAVIVFYSLKWRLNLLSREKRIASYEEQLTEKNLIIQAKEFHIKSLEIWLAEANLENEQLVKDRVREKIEMYPVYEYLPKVGNPQTLYCVPRGIPFFCRYINGSYQKVDPISYIDKK